MSRELREGDDVRVRVFGRVEPATVLQVSGDGVYVRMSSTGRRRVVQRVLIVEDRPTPLLPPPPPIAERRMVSVGARSPIVSTPKEPPARSRSYLDWVRAMPCCSCHAEGPSDPHHYGARGMGQKTDDYRVVPLCRRCHDTFHDQRKLPGMDVATTRTFLLQKQVDLLVRWASEEARKGCK